MKTETKQTHTHTPVFRAVQIPSNMTVHVEVDGEQVAVYYFPKNTTPYAALTQANARWFGPDLLEAGEANLPENLNLPFDDYVSRFGFSQEQAPEILRTAITKAKGQ